MYGEEENVYFTPEQEMFISTLLRQQKEDIKNKIKQSLIDHQIFSQCFCGGKWGYHLEDKEFDSLFE